MEMGGYGVAESNDLKAVNKVPWENGIGYPGIQVSTKLQHFGRNVSIVGCRYVADIQANFLRRLLWLSFVLGGSVFSLYQIQDRISYYVSSPTTVNMKINNNRSMTFPTVTLCSENPIARSKVLAAGGQEMVTMLEKAFPPMIHPNLPQNLTELDILLEPYKQLNWLETLQNFTFDPKDYVLQCRFGGNVCSHEDFTQLITDFSICLQFNTDGKFTTGQAGSSSGLDLILHNHQEEYIIPHSPGAGFSILLHNADESPIISQFATKASVNEVTSIQVTLEEVEQLPRPYGDCSEELGYVYHDCFLKCRADFQYKQCGCVEAGMVSITNRSMCAPDVSPCLREAENRFVERDVLNNECVCPQQCFSRIYSQAVSSQQLSTFFKNFIVNNLKRNGTRVNMTIEEIEHNFVQVTIFYSQLQYEKITVVRGYSWAALMSDIGGAMGLIVGSTVLTVVEIVDFIVVVSYEGCIQYRKQRKAKPMESKIETYIET